VNDKGLVLGMTLVAIQTLKLWTFTGYPMVALTERARRNMSMTYPVVI
jgi:hypothetical protein